MRTFHQVVVTILFATGIFGAVLLTSCKDKCGGTTCNNGGSCDNNVCSCPTGYSGADCGTSWVTKYIGTYNCVESCTPATSTGKWQSAITASATNGGYEITISNFNNSNVSYDATVDSTNHLTLVPGTIAGVAGTGTINTTTNVVTIYFTASRSGGGGSSCTMTMTRL